MAGLILWFRSPFVVACVVAVLWAAGTIFLGSGLDLASTSEAAGVTFLLTCFVKLVARNPNYVVEEFLGSLLCGWICDAD